MTNRKLGGWLLVAIAVLGLAFAAPVVSAHVNETTTDDAPMDGNATIEDAPMDGNATIGDAPMDGNATIGDAPMGGDAPTDGEDADAWAAVMESHMTDHMGPGAVEWMESHAGVTVDEMAQDMADGTHVDGGISGQGHGC